jgi:predicted adenylyl cyclase CyaB
MANNIEIKARVADRSGLEANARKIADRGPIEIAQDDTFFTCPNGRLKLREFADGNAQLIFYQRADQSGPKNSFYQIVDVANPAELRAALALAYGIVGRVIKQRTLYLVGRTRIHLDRIVGLGDFMELEVVLADGNPVLEAEQEARDLMQKLGVRAEQLIADAYIDMLNSRS